MLQDTTIIVWVILTFTIHSKPGVPYIFAVFEFRTAIMKFSFWIMKGLSLIIKLSEMKVGLMMLVIRTHNSGVDRVEKDTNYIRNILLAARYLSIIKHSFRLTLNDGKTRQQPPD